MSNSTHFTNTQDHQIFEIQNDDDVIFLNVIKRESTRQSHPCISIKEAYDTLCKFESSRINRPNNNTEETIPSSKGKMKRNECTKCNRSFLSLDSLTYHQNHDCGRIQKMICPYCDYRAEKSFNVRRHIKSKHPDRVPEHIDTRKPSKTLRQAGYSSCADLVKKKFFCNNCSLGVYNELALIKHVTSACGKLFRKFACPYCEYRANKSSNVNNHIQSKHKGEEVVYIKLDYDNEPKNLSETEKVF